MKKRINKKYEDGTVGAIALALLSAHDFDMNKINPTKTFYDGYDGKLFARITACAWDNRVSISFGGTGVKKDRTMDYYAEDLVTNGKFDARIKRVMRVAQDKADYELRKNERNVTAFDRTNQQLRMNGINDARMRSFGSDAIFVVNGYQLQCGSDLMISVNVGGNRIKLEVLAAVQLMNSIMPNPEPEED